MSTQPLEPQIAIGATSNAASTAPSAPAETTRAETSSLVANLRTAVLITLVTTLIFGLLYPLAVTGVSQVTFPGNANGQTRILLSFVFG